MSQEDEHLAPVIPLFGGANHGARSSGADENADGSVGDTRSEHPARPRGPVPLGAHASGDGDSAEPTEEPDPVEVRRRAEEALVRKLRSRALSVFEARSVLRENRLPRDEIDEVIDDFTHRGYIDDHTLASLLVTSGVERKKQGRVALARALAQRGIPREIIDEALAELPDDDAERALEFARTKARGMDRLDPETALRRLMGQLARRGYNGRTAMEAARTALREAGNGGSGVRFVDSD